MPEARAATGSSNPTPKARGGSREGQPHIQGVVAVRGQEEKGTTEDEMVGWHHQLDGYEFE